MRLLPKDKVGKISFYKSRLAKWAQHAAEIGVSPERIASLAMKVEAAAEARAAQGAAKGAAESATLRLDGALEEMEREGAGIIQQVRSEARITGNDGIYGLALIPMPEKGSPIAEPGTPSQFKCKLNGDGSIMLSWKCKNPRGAVGTVYQVYRRTGDAGTYEFLGAVGQKKIRDAKIPPGTAHVTYQVRATRSTTAGQSAFHPVSLGGGLPMMRMKSMSAYNPANAAA